MKLPNVIYVTVGGSGDSEYLDAHDTPDKIELDLVKVGIYELRDIQIKHITHSLEKKKKGGK
jgi:hypothetical protein